MRPAGLTFAGLIILASCTDDGVERQQVETTAAAATSPGPTTTSPPPSTAIRTIASTSTTTTTSTTSTTMVPVAGVRRPVLDPATCEPVRTYEGIYEDYTLNPFAISRDSPKAMQVIADAEDGFGGAFALLIRFPTDVLRAPGDEYDYEPVDTGEGTAWVTVWKSGSAEAIWPLSDGGTAYIRGLGFDVETLAAMVAGLSPTESAAPKELPVPPFEFEPGRGPAEHLAVLAAGTAVGAAGFGRSFECQTTDGATNIRGLAVGGDPLLIAALVLDQPAPYSHGARGDTALSLQGFWTPHDRPPDAPTVDDIIESDPELWAELLDAPADS